MEGYYVLNGQHLITALKLWLDEAYAEVGTIVPAMLSVYADCLKYELPANDRAKLAGARQAAASFTTALTLPEMLSNMRIERNLPGLSPAQRVVAGVNKSGNVQLMKLGEVCVHWRELRSAPWQPQASSCGT